MSGYQVLIPPRIASLVTAETVHGALQTPYADLRRKVAVDLADDVRILSDEFQRNHVSRSMDTFICSSTTHKRRFFGIIGICFGDGASCDECSEEVTFNCLLEQVSTE